MTEERFDVESILKVALVARFGRHYSRLTINSFKLRSMGEFVPEMALLCDIPGKDPFHVQPVIIPREFTEEQIRGAFVPFTGWRVEEVLEGRPDPFEQVRQDFKNSLFRRLYGVRFEVDYSPEERELSALLGRPIEDRKAVIRDVTKVTGRGGVMNPSVVNNSQTKIPNADEILKLYADVEGNSPKSLKHLAADYTGMEFRIADGINQTIQHPNMEVAGSMTGRLPREPEMMWPPTYSRKLITFDSVSSDEGEDDAAENL